MAKRLAPNEFKRNEAVKTLDDLAGVPQGTAGRVYLVDGFAWTRYRVLFDNGVDIGSLDGSTLARPRDYEAALDRRERAAELEAAADDSRGDRRIRRRRCRRRRADKSVNGVAVPAHLLDRSKRARERLAA